MNAPISAENSAKSQNSAEEKSAMNESAPDHEGFEVAYVRMAPKIAAIMKLIRVNTDISTASDIALAAAPRIREFAEQLQALPGFDSEALAELELSAKACLWTHVMVGVETLDKETIEEAKVLREHLLRSAELMAHCELTDAEVVRSIRSSIGHAGLTNGLVRLAALHREGWPRFAGKVPVSVEQLARAEELAERIKRVRGQRRLGAASPLAMRKRTRAQAFTLLVRNYEECQRALAYLRYYEGDAEQIAPPLFRRAKPARKQEDGADESAPTIIV